MVEMVKFCHQKSKKQHEEFSLQMAPHSPAGSPTSPSFSLHRDWGSPGLRAQSLPTVGATAPASALAISCGRLQAWRRALNSAIPTRRPVGVGLPQVYPQVRLSKYPFLCNAPMLSGAPCGEPWSPASLPGHSRTESRPLPLPVTTGSHCWTPPRCGAKRLSPSVSTVLLGVPEMGPPPHSPEGSPAAHSGQQLSQGLPMGGGIRIHTGQTRRLGS